MQVAVWDTYVTRKDGTIMHFDIVAPDTIKNEQTIHRFGKDFLLSKDEENQPLTSKECRFCHIDKASPEIEASVAQKEYYIIEMEGC